MILCAWSIKKYRNDIQTYCTKNNLDFIKLDNMIKGCGENDIVILARTGKESSLGLLDETPMPAVLRIQKTDDGTLHFEQTEHTKRYLA